MQRLVTFRKVSENEMTKSERCPMDRYMAMALFLQAFVVVFPMMAGCREGTAPYRSKLPRTATGSAPKVMELDLGDGVKMRLVLVPSGEFTMGEREEDQRRPDSAYFYSAFPQHKVTVTRSFYMGVCRVTQGQYRHVMGKNRSGHEGSELPVTRVSWHDAVRFCEKLSKQTNRVVRLPTEAEWEYACRSGSSTRFCYGDNEDGLGEYAWYGKKESEFRAEPVGVKNPNAFGLHDMHGNVGEWCWDYYGKYHSASQADPVGPSDGDGRVVRGGSYNDNSAGCRSAGRNCHSASDETDDFIGFRIVIE